MQQSDRPDDDGGKQATPGQDDLSARLDRLETQLERHRSSKEARNRGADNASSDYGRALRLSTEFIAAIVVGGGLGWFLDKWLGVAPWGMIVFLLLGFLAGIVNVLRSAGLMSTPVDSERDNGIDEPPPGGGA